jgi:hypothetical protein
VLAQKLRNRSSDVWFTTVFQGACRSCLPTFGHGKDAVRLNATVPSWQQVYRATRPIAERKIAPCTRRPWGGRQARCRGRARILTDVLTPAAAINLANLAIQGLHFSPHGWATA